MNYSEKTLAEIVNENPAAAAVMEKHGLDYCCKGKRTLSRACDEQRINLLEVEKGLEQLMEWQAGNAALIDFNKLNPGELVDHIVKRHHTYVREALPMISAHLEKLASRHGGSHPELIEIESIFKAVQEELEQHMQREEVILFPMVKEIGLLQQSGSLASINNLNMLEGPMQVMEQEHENAGSSLYRIRALTGNYQAPEDACTTYRICYHELREFETDLHAHVHLENNILFPRVRQIISGLATVSNS